MSVIPLPIRGVLPTATEATHPRWADGAPILCGDDVEHVEYRWTGLVVAVGFDEVTVSWDLDDGEVTDGEEYAPDDLRRVG